MRGRLWIAVALSFALAAGCGGGGGGGGGGDDGVITTVTGTVLAPGGLVARFDVLEDGADFMAMRGEGFPMPAGAAMGLLPFWVGPDPMQPVPGATLELIQVDDFGVQVGEVLATTITSTTGGFTFTLAAGVDLSAKLVVQAVAPGGGAPMRAQLVALDILVDPLSEMLLDSLTSDGNTLANVSANEVVMLRGYMEQYDYTTGVDLQATYAAIEAVLGSDLDPLLTQCQTTPGDATSVAGEWSVTDVSLKVTSAPGVSALNDVGTIIVTDLGGPDGTVDISQGVDFTAWQNATPDGGTGIVYTDLGVESSIETGGEAWPFLALRDGSIAVLPMWEEEIFDANAPPGLPAGQRSLGATEVLYPLSSPNGSTAMAGALSESQTFYPMNGEGTALDLGTILGREIVSGLDILVKKQAIDNATLDGSTYGFVNFGWMLSSSGYRELDSSIGLIDISALTTTTGTVTVSTNELFLQRTPVAGATGAAVNWNQTSGAMDDPIGTDDGPEDIGYVIDPATGIFNLASAATAPDTDEVIGFVGNGGDLLAIRSMETADSPITDAGGAVALALKLPTTNPSCSGTAYRVLWLERIVETDGSRANLTVGSSTRMVFDGAGQVTMNGMYAGMSRGNAPGFEGDLSPDLESMSETITDLIGSYQYIPYAGLAGYMEMDLGDIQLSGFVNEGGRVGVFRVVRTDLAANGQAGLGIAIIIKIVGTG